MIYRHFNAPSRAFTQFSNELIRHPRLSSDSVRLLTWQLSLPQGALESLSTSAQRARIGGCAFTRAKRQLKEEGFVHERRVQVARGRWVTQQLVSNTPLTADQAVKLLSRIPAPTCTDPVTPQVTPSTPTPAVGQPTTPPTDRHPDKQLGEDTSNLPARTADAADTDADTDTVDEPSSLEDARALIGVLHLLSPALRHIPPGMRDELARLAARWLNAGHTSTDVHEHILRGLPGTGTPVHRPGGLVRYLLRDVPPLAPPPRPAPQLSTRLQGTRECTGHHTQPMLFRPLTDETLCPACVPPGREPVHGPS